jgi:hypothetical protein
MNDDDDGWCWKKRKDSEKEKGDRLIGDRAKESTAQSIHKQIKN